MTSLILLFGLMFGIIAVWAGIALLKPDRKPKPRRPIVARRASDPWGVTQMRRGEIE
jgi:hypothetical protein